jgi:hypothetical protein
LGQGTHVVPPSDGDAADDGDAGADAAAALAPESADVDPTLAPASDMMASTPITAATIPERAVTERRLNMIFSQLLGASPKHVVIAHVIVLLS